MSKKDPQNTRGIEKAWFREINRRWALYTKVTIAELRRMNDEALMSVNNHNISIASERITTNAEPVGYDAARVRTYMEFIRIQIDDILLGAQVGAFTPDESWQWTYQRQSYQRSLDAFQAELVRQGAAAAPSAAEVRAATLLEPLTAIPSLATSAAINFPIHRDALEFLFTRSLNKLKGWTDALATETRQITMDSISQGRGINETVRELRSRIDVSRSRARLIARTEISQAFQHAQTNEAVRASEFLGEPILLRWFTVRDARVRHLHAVWHGTLANPRENARRIGKSPFNCRCAQLPVIKEANTPQQQAKFDEQRAALMRLERD